MTEPLAVEVVMLIRDILSLKGGALFHIDPQGRLSDAIDAMVRHDVGSLVVLENERLVGMLTFREVLKALNGARGNAAALAVSEVLVPDPLCGGPSDTIDDLRALMTQHHVRYLPVKQDGKV